MAHVIGDTPQQLAVCATADAMMIDGKIVTKADYLALVAQVETLKQHTNVGLLNVARKQRDEAAGKLAAAQLEVEDLTALAEALAKDRDEWREAMARAASVLLLHKVPTKTIDVEKL